MGELSARSGLPPPTLRYYEELGLLTSTRSAGGHRRYERWVLRRLAVIAAGRRIGLPLATIRADLDRLPADRAPTRAEWAGLASAWRAHVDARVRELHALQEDLAGCVGCGCLSLDRCPLRNPGDEAAAEGPGARALRRARPAGA